MERFCLAKWTHLQGSINAEHFVPFQKLTNAHKSNLFESFVKGIGTN